MRPRLPKAGFSPYSENLGASFISLVSFPEPSMWLRSPLPDFWNPAASLAPGAHVLLQEALGRGAVELPSTAGASRATLLSSLSLLSSIR